MIPRCKTFPQSRHPTLIAWLLAGLLVVPVGTVWSADQKVEVDTARTALKKWVEIRRIMSQEKRDWALSQEVLNERIDLIEHELKAQSEKISEAEASIMEADEKLAELLEEHENLQDTLTTLTDTVANLEARTITLLKQLPPPIRERVRPLSQRLPEDSAAPNSSLAERFQTIIGILNEVNKFNREITVTSEVRALPNGTSAEVAVMYVGIGHAYYVNTTRTTAGVGTASLEGWVWKPADAAAEQIANAIAILKNEQVAAFVRLPFNLQQTAPEQ